MPIYRKRPIMHTGEPLECTVGVQSIVTLFSSWCLICWFLTLWFRRVSTGSWETWVLFLAHLSSPYLICATSLNFYVDVVKCTCSYKKRYSVYALTVAARALSLLQSKILLYSGEFGEITSQSVLSNIPLLVLSLWEMKLLLLVIFPYFSFWSQSIFLVAWLELWMDLNYLQ